MNIKKGDTVVLLTGKYEEKKDADGNAIEEEQKIQIGVAPDGLAMVIKL